MTDDDHSDLDLSECLAGIAADTPDDEDSTPTPVVYHELQQAWTHFNKTLFDGRLPQALITLSRTHASPGWYNKQQFVNDTGKQIGEIILNPAWFGARSIRANLAEIVHQMVHQAQHAGGKPGRVRYHNRQFAKLCDDIGLVTTADGTPTGTPTGENVTHLIIEGEAFARAAQSLLTDAFRMTWLDRYPVKPDEADMRTLTRQALELKRRGSEQGPTASQADAGAHPVPRPTITLDLGNAENDEDDPHVGTSSGAQLNEDEDPSDRSTGRLDLGESDVPAVTDLPLMKRTAAMEKAMGVKEKARTGKSKTRYRCTGNCKGTFWGKSGIDVTCNIDGGRYVPKESGEKAVAEPSPAPATTPPDFIDDGL